MKERFAQERLRKFRKHIELTPQILLSGEYECPFNKGELEVLETLIAGAENGREIMEKLGITEHAYKTRRDRITAKVKNMYPSGGSDNLAKAVSLSTIGGWTRDQYSGIDAELSAQEFSVLFKTCFGYSFKEQAEQFPNTKTVQDIKDEFNGIKEKIGLTGKYQVTAWGAGLARRWMLESEDNMRAVSAMLELVKQK